MASASAQDQEAVAPAGSGDESSLMTGLRLLRSGLPNLVLRRGRVLLDSPGYRQEKWISRAELELSPEQAGIRPFGIERLWIRAFVQRSDRRFLGIGDDGSREADEPAVAEGTDRRTTDHAFIRLNGSVGSPLSWNVAFEDRNTHLPDSERARNLRRFQKFDASVQTQPHSSLDAFFRLESSRDLFWHPEGGGGGFGVRRLALATIQLYPGRVFADLAPLSFRIDLSGSGNEDGEPGIDLPGAGSLWREASDFSRRQRARSTTLESRVQLLAWMRWVERWELGSGRNTREKLESESASDRIENRLEIRPRGGLLTLRAIGTHQDEKGSESEKQRHFSSQWDQTWGRGLLSYLALDAYRTETRNRALGDLTYLWNPQGRLTWRRTRWQVDATLGGSLSWTRTKDRSLAIADQWNVLRRQSLNASLSAQPVRILTVKLQYDFNRSERDPNAPEAGLVGRWEIDHDLRLRLMVRA